MINLAKSKKINLYLFALLSLFFIIIFAVPNYAQAALTATLTSPKWQLNIPETMDVTVNTQGAVNGQTLQYYIWYNCNSAAGSGYEDLVSATSFRCGPYNDSWSGTSSTKTFSHRYTVNDQGAGGWGYTYAVVKQGTYYVGTNRLDLLLTASSSPVASTTATYTPSPSPSPSAQPSLGAKITGGSGGFAPYSTKYMGYVVNGAPTPANFYFYCTRTDDNLNIGAPFETDISKYSPWLMTKSCVYNSPGQYSPKVIIKQGTKYAQSRMLIDVKQPATNVTAGLSANPSPARADQTVTLTGTATSNNTTDTFNYSFWWNCASTANTYSQTVSECGLPTNSAVGAKFDNVSATTVQKSVQHLYNQPDIYKPKIIIEQGNGKATASTSITVQDYPPVAKLEGKCLLIKQSGNNTDREFTLNGSDYSNDATSPRDYYFWWNCRNGSSDIAKTTADCGIPTHIYDGGYSPIANNLSFGAVYKDITATVKGTGTIRRPTYIVTDFKPKLIINKDGLSSTHEPEISCTAPSPTPTPSRTPSVTPSPTPPPISNLNLDLNVSPAESTPGQSVQLNAITSSNVNSGNYSYYFWWSCDKPTSDNLEQMKQDCGDPALAYVGSQTLNQPSSKTSLQVNHIYNTSGTFLPKALVVHSGLTKAASARINVIKPTLTAGLVVNPSTSEGAAKPATLSASAGGTAIGTVNYTFWWNCDQPGTDIAQITTKCGNPLDSSKGAKYTVNSTTKVVTHDYITSGVSKPKVVVERGSADPQQASAMITINEVPVSTFNVALSAARTNSEQELPALVDISANINGSATGATEYKIWWDCQPTSQELSQIERQCGSALDSTKGATGVMAENELSIKTSTAYSLTGLRHPFIYSTRQNIISTAATEINIQEVNSDTLSATLSVSNNSISTKETVDLIAQTNSNNSLDTYNYYFWWDCPGNDSKVLQEVINACGDPRSSAIGVVHMDLANTAITKAVSTQYLKQDQVDPRVFVEHGAVSANASATINIQDVPLDPSPTASVTVSTGPSPGRTASDIVSIVPSAIPSETPVASVSPRPSPSPTPTDGENVQLVYYYLYQGLTGKSFTSLSEYENLDRNGGIWRPVHNIYLSTDGGSTYERLEQDIDPMPGAVMSTLPLNIKSIAQPWRQSGSSYLKVTHNVSIPKNKLSNPSAIRLLVRVLTRQPQDSCPQGRLCYGGGNDLGQSFVFDSSTIYPNYAGPNTDWGDVMDFTSVSGLTPRISVTPSPAPSPVDNCSYSFTKPVEGESYSAQKIADIYWQNKSLPPKGSKANLFLSVDNGRSYKSILSDITSSSASYMFSSEQITAKAKLRIDHIDDNQPVSSCYSDVFAITSGKGINGSPAGAGGSRLAPIISSKANVAVVLGALLASIASMLLTSVASAPVLYRAANSLFALFAPPLWPSRKPQWGLVYDSVSKKPLENVIVRIFSEPDGKLRATIRTNAQGAFGFILPPGRYSAVAARAGYEFPTRLITGQNDGRLLNVYRGGIVSVHGDGQQKAQINLNIPLDRTKLSTFDIIQVHTLSTIARFFQVIRLPLLILGTISAGYLLAVDRRTIDWLIALLYVGLWTWEVRNMLKKRAYGLVKDSSGKPIPLALIRAIDTRGRLKETVVSADDGKFQLNLDPGFYKLDISRAGYRSVRTQLFRIDKVQDIGRLDLKLDKLGG